MIYSNDPLWTRSPWLDDISDETAEILVCTLHALAMACEDRYGQELRRYYQTQRAEFYDPQRPWIRKPSEPHSESPHDEEQARTDDFNARQLDLFRPEPAFDDDF